MKPAYKMTEVGVIPEDWLVKSLGELGRFKNGINKGASDFGHGFPLVNLLDVFGIPKLCTSVTDLGLVNSGDTERKVYDLKKGDLLFVRSSVKPEGVGLTTLVPADFPKTVFSGFLLRFRDFGELADEIKEHCFLQAGFRRRLIAASTVSANTNINQHALKKLPIWYPSSKPEQRAIATTLSDVDALLGALDRLIAKKRDLKQATMQQLLTGQTRLPGFSGEWEVIEFGDVAEIRNRKVLASTAPHGTRCVELDAIGQANGRLYGWIEANGPSAKYRFEAGDVLFGRLRAYLKKYWKATFSGICSTEIWPLIPKNARLVAGFLYQVVQTNSFIETAGVSYGTHMPRSDWGVLSRFPVALPLPEEQSAIATILSDMDAEIEALEARRAKTRDLKQAMMQELLTGRTRLV